jgi:hypothetical protein
MAWQLFSGRKHSPDPSSDHDRGEPRSVWQRPEEWSQLTASNLKALAEFGCLRYGRSRSQDDMEKIAELYELIAGQLSVGDRQQLVAGVTNAVEQGLGSADALLPFILLDPDVGPVSSAALNFAVLRPVEHGDPLTGPKYLLGEVVGGSTSEVTRAGVLMGLLLLGDRRVTHLLDRCWLTLSPEGRKQLAHARSGWTYESTVEFLLDWMEDSEARGDEAEFGLVAAAISNARVAAQHPSVLDVERFFPANGVEGAPPVRVLREQSFEEFGARIAPRLIPLYMRESNPTILDQVMDVWGIPVPSRVDLVEVATRLRGGDKDLELPEAPDGPDRTTLLAWGYFNPFGPTACRIDALPVPDTDELVLVSVSDHDAFPQYTAFALVPAGPERIASIRNELARVFAANGDGGQTWSLIGGLPSYVQIYPDSPVDSGTAAALFRSAVDTLETPDYRQEIEDLLRSRQDPWSQAAEAVKRAFEGPEAQRLITTIQRLEAGDPTSDACEDHDQELVEEDPAEADALFSLWFALASDRGHARVIGSQMGLAREGARLFQAGAFMDQDGR